MRKILITVLMAIFPFYVLADSKSEKLNNLMEAQGLLSMFEQQLAMGSVIAGVDLVKVDKSENRMYLLDGEKVVKEYHVAFGANPKSHKEQEGDEKTPEGSYTLDYKKEDSSFYRAMHISYPKYAFCGFK